MASIDSVARGSAIAADGRFILWGEHGHLASLDVTPQRTLLHLPDTA